MNAVLISQRKHMPMPQSQKFVIVEPSQIAEARRGAVVLARHLDFDEDTTAKIALVVTEASTNLIKHTKGGELIVNAISQGRRNGMELLSLDRGRGLIPRERCMSDGYSTTGSPGLGMGVMARCSAEFQVASWRDRGTGVLARWWTGPAHGPNDLSVGAVCLAKPEEYYCGDDWTLLSQAHRHVLLVVDGLGHGPAAARASITAIELLHAHPRLSPAEFIHAAHEALRPTRGAALAIAELDRNEPVVRFAGIGNVAGQIVDGDQRQHLISYNGIVGHSLRKVREYTYQWSSSSLLLMHTDGLTSQVTLKEYPDLAQHDPSLIAGCLYRDFVRGNDDATVVAVRELGYS